MNVRVQFFSHLKEIVGGSEKSVAVPEGATVADLLTVLYAEHPRLRDWDSSILIGAGVEFVERNYLLELGDEIAIMPPVQGG